jgi:chromosome segregation ATPase
MLFACFTLGVVSLVLAVAEYDLMKKKMESKVAGLEKQLQEANSSKCGILEASRRIVTRSKELEKKNDEAENEITALKQQMQTKVAGLEKQLQEANTSKTGILQLSRRIMDSQKELQKQKDAADEKITELEEQLDQSRDELDESKTKLDESKTKLEESNTQLEELKQQCADFEQQADAQWKSAEGYCFEADCEESKEDAKDMSWTSAEDYSFSDEDDDEEWEERHGYINKNLELDFNVAPFKGFGEEETEEELKKIDSFFTRR